MTSFEFVFGLISVITSLALTQLLSGMVTLYRCADHLRLSWRHACWTATAFMLLIGNWSALWSTQNIHILGVLDVLTPLLYTSVLYAFCDMVMPDKPADGVVLDLRAYHLREGKRYKMLQLIFAVLVIGAIARSAASFAEWMKLASFAMLAAVIGTVALRARSTWLDTATAVALTAMAALFMVLRLEAIST
jgi:hypothetical protein